MIENLRKFSKGPGFLSPVLEQHNVVVDCLLGTVGDVSSDGEISVNRAAGSLGLSLTNPASRIRFGTLTTVAYRGFEAYIQFYHFSQNQWHESNEPETIIDTTFMSGFKFYGDYIQVARLNDSGLYTVISPGISYAKFRLDEILIDGASAIGHPLDYPNGVTDDYPLNINDAEIWGPWGGAVADTIVGCFWNDGLLQWEAGLERCD